MKGFKRVLLILVFVLLLNANVYAYEQDIQLVVDGIDIDSHLKGDGELKYGFATNNRTFVPLRVIGESLGCDVKYNPTNKDISITDGKINIQLNVDSRNFKVNGTAKSMDVKPIILNNRTFVPIRYIGEAFRKPVSWDGKNKVVYVGHAINQKGEDLSKLKKLDYSKYGFDLYVAPEFEQQIIGVESPSGQSVEFYAKELYKKGSSDGNVGEIGIGYNGAEISPYLNLYHENGKVLTYAWFTGNFLNKHNPGTKFNDKALETFKKAIVLPSKNKFPNFSFENLNKVTETAKAPVSENPKKKPANANYQIYTFGNPKVTVKIPKDLMKELIVEKYDGGFEKGYVVYHKKTVEAKNKNFGGTLAFYAQHKFKPGDYEMFDEMNKLVDQQGNVRTTISSPRDLQFNVNSKKMTEEFNKTSIRLSEEVICTVEKR